MFRNARFLPCWPIEPPPGTIAERSPLRLQPRNGESSPPSGRKFNYRPVQICQASSLEARKLKHEIAIR
jgi:hypothetical protein